MIRISSQQIFSDGISRLQALNVGLNSTQQQISTGKRVNNPSDDPVAAARILKLDHELSRIQTYQRNVDLADNRLKQEESALERSIDVIQRVRELTVQAGNGALSANDRSSIASELEQRLGQLATIANTRDASGEYVFSGFQSSVKAFEQSPSGGSVYQGDEGQRDLEVDDGVTVAISDNGKDIFVNIAAAITGENTSVSSGAAISGVSLVNKADLQAAYPGSFPSDISVQIDETGNLTAYNSAGDPLPVTPAAYQSGESFEVVGVQATVTGPLPAAGNVDVYTLEINKKQSVFGTIENLISGLNNIDKRNTDGQTEYRDLIAHSLTNLDNAQETVLLKQTELGGRMSALESTRTFLGDSSLYTSEIRARLQDVDYAEAISNLSFQSFVLQAAQQSFARVSQLSLFDRL